MGKRRPFFEWKKWCVIMLALFLTFSLSACGGEEGKEKSLNGQGEYTDEEVQKYYDAGIEEDNDAENEAADAGIEEGNDVENEAADAGAAEGDVVETAEEKIEGSQSAEQQTVSKEMLVYRGTLAIDTLEFDQSVEDFKNLLSQVGGFVEKENYTDDAERYDDYYAVEENEKHNSYTATIRVPSTQYNTVMDGAGNLGDVRSKTSNVQNVTQQYGTYQSQIKIYEAEYQRYLKLLEKASEDEYALQIEQKLFELQVKIAEIKSSITNLETDVAYSYIDVTLTEVKKYQAQPGKTNTNTFLDRLIHTCKNSWNVFLFLIEKILFCIIYTWYYIAAILLLLFVVFKVQRKNPQSQARGKRKDAVPEMEEDFEEEEPESYEDESEDEL